MLAHERPHLTQLHRIGTDQERQQASPYRTFDKPSWNDRCLRKAAIDHRQTNVGLQGNIADRTRAISIALFDRGHCLAGHPSEGGDFLFDVDRLRRELAVL